MVYKDNEGLKLAQLKIKYIKNGQEVEQEIGEEGKRWWLEFEQKWDNIQIVEFTDIEYTQEQLSRLEEVKDFKYLTEDVENYVTKGIFENVINEGLKQLKLKKDNEDMQDLLAGLIGGAL